MNDVPLHAFLSRLPARTGNWANAGAHATPGAGAVLRVQRLKNADAVSCETQALSSLDPALFEEFVDAVMAANASLTSVEQTYCRLLKAGAGRMATFTFDAPSRATMALAHPILKKRGIPMTVFVSPTAADTGVAPWWLALEALVLASNSISIAVRGQTFRARCHTPQEKSETLDNLAPLLLAQPPQVVHRAVLAVCEADGIDLSEISADVMRWGDLKRLAQDPLVTIGLLAPECHATGAASYDAVLESVTWAKARVEKELSVTPAHLAFGAGWHGFVEQRDLEIANTLGFHTACLPAGGALFAEDAATFAILPRMVLSDSTEALLDAQASCGAALGSTQTYWRKASVA